LQPIPLEPLLGLLALGNIFGDAKQILRVPVGVQDGDLLGVQEPRAKRASLKWLLGSVDHCTTHQHLAIVGGEEISVCG
jgi:hypothetical protein